MLLLGQARLGPGFLPSFRKVPAQQPLLVSMREGLRSMKECRTEGPASQERRRQLRGERCPAAARIAHALVQVQWRAPTRFDRPPLGAQVLQCYREAPTAAARRNMFSVLFDYVVAGQVCAGRLELLPRPVAHLPRARCRLHCPHSPASGCLS